ncbi:MAG: hypothetical protein U9Q21_01090 [Candidatus Auribacterota bacterium]|nr:hypothetical protein [Candidatus Auribacterota bacterium]
MKNKNLMCIVLVFLLMPFTLVVAQEKMPAGEKVLPQAQAEVFEMTEPGYVSMDFKNADIRSVLKLLSYKSGTNIVAGPEVQGLITIRLTNVLWEEALEVILRTYGYGYEKKGNIITAMPVDDLAERTKAYKDLSEIVPLTTKVFILQYLDADDIRKVLSEQLSPRGKITVLKVRGQTGWSFSDEQFGRKERMDIPSDEKVRSKTLIISDIPSSLEKLGKVIAEIDIRPKQILIEAKLMEVNHDKLKDLGIDWGTGSSGAESDTVTGVAVNKKSKGGGTKINAATVGAQMLGSQVTPSVFIPKATGLDGTLDYDTGLELIFKKLTGTEFEIIIHALEEDVDTNTLSAPRVVTLNNQEAAILVGRKYPIVKEEYTAAYTAIKTHSLEEWLNYGIQLNVVPQICGVDEINMIVHPSITSLVSTLGGEDVAYPILDIREAETQILMRDGETVVIGGLLKDVVKEGVYKVPFLGDIPLLGLLFQRQTHNTQKVDLLIFITAHIIKTDEFGNTAPMPGIERFEASKTDVEAGNDKEKPE